MGRSLKERGKQFKIERYLSLVIDSYHSACLIHDTVFNTGYFRDNSLIVGWVYV